MSNEKAHRAHPGRRRDRLEGARARARAAREKGDLYVALTVEPHPYFSREGDDILAEVPVTVSEAYLGAEIDVPTIHGPGARADPARDRRQASASGSRATG